MNSYKTYFGILAIGLGFAAYALYIASTLKNKTKPHAFSWLLWTLTTGIVFTAQVIQGAGAGSWATGFTCTVCFAIGIISLFKYDKKYSMFDVLFIAIALVALLPWFFTSNPTLSVVIIASIDVLGYGPTLYKSYYFPSEEKAISFGLNSLKHCSTLIAMGSYSVVTCIYPVTQVIMNALVVFLIVIWKRNQ